MSPVTWDLLADLSLADSHTVLALTSTRSYESGEEIFSLGDAAHHLFLVERGSVKLTLPITVGDRQVDAMVGERGPGHMLGWSGLIPPHRFTVKASSVSDTELLIMEQADLLELFQQRPMLGCSIYGNLCRIIGQRLQVFQTLWVREMQHVVRTKTL